MAKTAKKIFHTYYDVTIGDGGLYGGRIEAVNTADAARLARQRGFGERVVGVASGHDYRLLGLIDAKKWTDAAHEAAYIGFVALQAGVATPEEILGDSGLVHELIHLATIYSSHAREDTPQWRRDQRARASAYVKALAIDIERRIPGHPESRKKLA